MPRCVPLYLVRQMKQGQDTLSAPHYTCPCVPVRLCCHVEGVCNTTADIATAVTELNANGSIYSKCMPDNDCTSTVVSIIGAVMSYQLLFSCSRCAHNIYGNIKIIHIH